MSDNSSIDPGNGENMMIKDLRKKLYGDENAGPVEPLKNEKICIFCGSYNDLLEFKGTYICKKCLQDI